MFRVMVNGVAVFAASVEQLGAERAFKEAQAEAARRFRAGARVSIISPEGDRLRRWNGLG